jgi:hypothetical protein
MSDPTRNVLLLTFARRGEERAIQRAISALAEVAPGAQVIAVGTPVSAPVLRDLGIATILVYGDGKSARQVIEEAQLFMPEAAAIVYDNPRFRAHLKLEALALLIRVRTVLRCPPSPQAAEAETQLPKPETIGRLRLAWSVLTKGLHLLLRRAAATTLTALACSYLCWFGRPRGGRHASRP